MHKQEVYRFYNSIEYEYKFMGKYGAKGEKRAPKSKATPEQIKKQNQLNRENRMRRKIKANFLPDDLWITLKPAAGKKKSIKELTKDVSNFLTSLKRAYKKRDADLKYICRFEVGKRGGLHCHILLNRIRGKPETDILVRDKWKRYGGSVSYESIYENGGYRKLAEYIVKLPEEEVTAQLSFFPEEDRKTLVKYTCSRNLTTPVPEVKEYTRKTVKKLIENGPEPTPGFYIDKESIKTGTNPYTGMSYLYYTEIRIKEIRRSNEWENGYG